MILLDTSVLINYFRNTIDESVLLLDEIIDRNMPYGICDFVYQELLQGTKSEKEFNILKEYLESLPFYYLNHESTLKSRGKQFPAFHPERHFSS